MHARESGDLKREVSEPSSWLEQDEEPSEPPLETPVRSSVNEGDSVASKVERLRVIEEMFAHFDNIRSKILNC